MRAPRGGARVQILRPKQRCSTSSLAGTRAQIGHRARSQLGYDDWLNPVIRANGQLSAAGII
jgi:hypothetical protein